MRAHLLVLVLGVRSLVDDALRVVCVPVLAETTHETRLERVNHVDDVQSTCNDKRTWSGSLPMNTSGPRRVFSVVSVTLVASASRASQLILFP